MAELVDLSRQSGDHIAVSQESLEVGEKQAYKETALLSIITISAEMKQWLRSQFERAKAVTGEDAPLEKQIQMISNDEFFAACRAFADRLILIRRLLGAGQSGKSTTSIAELKRSFDQELEESDHQLPTGIGLEEMEVLARLFLHDILPKLDIQPEVFNAKAASDRQSVIKNYEEALTGWFGNKLTSSDRKKIESTLERLRTSPDIELKVAIISSIKEILDNYNLDEGVTSVIVDVSELQKQIMAYQTNLKGGIHVASQAKINFEVSLSEREKNLSTTFNPLVAIVALNNAVSNLNKLAEDEQYQTGEKQLIMEVALEVHELGRLRMVISDNGPGFKHTNDDISELFPGDIRIVEAQIAQDASDWTHIVSKQRVTGTGTGLAGLKTIVSQADQNAVVRIGNQINDAGEVQGATILLDFPILDSEATATLSETP